MVVSNLFIGPSLRETDQATVRRIASQVLREIWGFLSWAKIQRVQVGILVSVSRSRRI